MIKQIIDGIVDYIWKLRNIIMEEYQCFEHSLNPAVDEVPESPLSSTLFGYANRFDSGLRHDYEMREMLIFQCFSHFSLLNILITLDYTFIFPCSLFVAI